MEIGRKLYIKNSREWRSWLKKNYKTEKRIWLIYPKKNSGKKRIDYNHAVEEALCFGWIDSTVKTLDEQNIVQQFTPRNPKSKYSQPNKERLMFLAEQKKIIPEIMEKVKPILNEKFVFPKDIIERIKKNKEAWSNFRKFSESYKRVRISYIDSARRDIE